ncbi:flagellar basal body rod protein FlgC [Paenibacillus sp. 598K]|uniref:flagellar basal body rod protein FlgC n=1 Tax=Paenibacillus sp. 598K TaxID=1117987 RepID=UPI000FF9066F|nr:flagellar basal body rod protein FlgC [Paenibacillus sp. 598K]GBF71994.1 flagellar basal body rod protein FlgC [Paenibacillus sp. 598K]
MKLSNGFDASSSALTAQRFRMDIISSNIANAETTRGRLVNGVFEPYTRKMAVMSPIQPKFADILGKEMSSGGQAGGVKVTQVMEDRTPPKLVYNPSHPDADPQGYVKMPNVDVLKEMVDMISATRSYEANVTALNATKAMFTKALEIGRA